jgi:hypothetical protein
MRFARYPPGLWQSHRHRLLLLYGLRTSYVSPSGIAASLPGPRQPAHRCCPAVSSGAIIGNNHLMTAAPDSGRASFRTLLTPPAYRPGRIVQCAVSPGQLGGLLGSALARGPPSAVRRTASGGWILDQRPTTEIGRAHWLLSGCVYETIDSPGRSCSPATRSLL